MEKSELLKKLEKKKTNCKKRKKEYYFLTGGGIAGLVYGSCVLSLFVTTSGLGFAILGGIGIYTTYKENKEYTTKISELEKRVE